jgi:hypothetical protein
MCTLLACDAAVALEMLLPIERENVEEGYKSYTLLLICDSAWAEAQKRDALEGLYSTFERFGDVLIGDENAAVWFWKSSPRTGHRSPDLRRSQQFCANLRLPGKDSPYIVFTTDYPGASQSDHPESFNKLTNYCTVALAGRSAEYIRSFLDVVSIEMKKVGSNQSGQDGQNFWGFLDRLWEEMANPGFNRDRTAVVQVLVSTEQADRRYALLDPVGQAEQ